MFSMRVTSFFPPLLLALALLGGPADRIGAQGTGPWDVATAGARPGGAEDCTTVFQKLLDEAGRAGGGVVTVPAGRYRINGHLTLPANVTLEGI